MAQVADNMIKARHDYNVKSDILKRVIADQRLRHDFNVCQRLPKTPRKPSPSQYRRNQEAVVMLALIAAAYMFVDELPKELEEAGIYRHNNKRVANIVEQILKKASRTAEEVLKAANNGKASTGYFDCMDAFYGQINESIQLPPPERVYNILKAMCRLVGVYNKKLNEYHFSQAPEVAKIPTILEQIPIHDYEIDNIIDLAVRPIVFNVKY